MPLPRFNKLAPDKRRSILDAARGEFAARGFKDASLNRIIAAARISKGAMYYYFADKADLYGLVLDDVLDQVAAATANLPEPADSREFWAMLETAVARLGEAAVGDPELAALARGLYRSEGGPTFQRLLDRSRGWIEVTLALGQRLGAIRDDLPRDLLAESVTGLLVAVDRWFVEAFEHRTPEELMSLVPKVMGLVRDLVATRSSS